MQPPLPALRTRLDRQPEEGRFGASTPFDFSGKNLTPYGGLLPVATMLEKLGFQALLPKGKVAVEGRMAALLELGSGFHPELTGMENLRLNASLQR